MKEQNTSTSVFELTATLIFLPLFASAVQMEALEGSTKEVRFDLDFERQSLRRQREGRKAPQAGVMGGVHGGGEQDQGACAGQKTKPSGIRL